MRKIAARVSIVVGTLASVATIITFAGDFFHWISGDSTEDPVEVINMHQIGGDNYTITLKYTSPFNVWVITHSNYFQKKPNSKSNYKEAFPFLEMNKDISNLKMLPGEEKEILYDFGGQEYKNFMFANFEMGSRTCYCIEESDQCWKKSQVFAGLVSQRNISTEQKDSCKSEKQS